MPDFSLSKWYMDAADVHGHAYIGYWAVLRWKGLSFHFYQHLWHTPERGAFSKAEFIARDEPDWLSSDEFAWTTPEVNARWCSVGLPPITETFFQTDQGAIEWTCPLPRSHASIQSAELSFEGFGYVERIKITIPPWKLPLKTLYWGRALSQNHSMVWIKWEGPVEKCLLWHDGQRSETLSISDSSVDGPGIRWEVEDSATLRQGLIGATVFKPFQKIASLFPDAALLLDEHKLVGRGAIHAGVDHEPATAIYERVVW